MDRLVDQAHQLGWLWQSLTVIAGVTLGLLALMYRRWWRDAVEQLQRSRQTTRILSRRLSAYRIRAAARLDEQLVDELHGQADAPDSPGGATPGPVEGA